MFMMDLWYFVFLAPGMLLAMWAQWRVQAAYNWASGLRASTGITGAQTAYAILQAEGISDVGIEPIAGQLSDHYDPTTKTLRLSEGVYGADSLAALGIAAHEVGHALQDASEGRAQADGVHPGHRAEVGRLPQARRAGPRRGPELLYPETKMNRHSARTRRGA